MKKSIISIIAIIAILALFFAFKSAGNTDPFQISATDWVIGGGNPKVVIIEYSDYQCPACQYFFEPVKKIVEKYPQDMLLVYRHFPLAQHFNATKAAAYAEAAGKQEKFWEMSKIIFDNQEEWSNSSRPDEIFIKYAESLKLDIEKIKVDASSRAIYREISSDQKSGIKAELGWTPTFIVNGKIIQNPNSMEDFEKLLVESMNK